MKPTHLLLSAALGMTPLAVSAQMTPETAPVTDGSAKTLEKVWKPGIRWIAQKPGKLERLDGTTITIMYEPNETENKYVVYENGERLQVLPSLKEAREYAEKRARYLVELKVLPRTIVDPNAEEDMGTVKGVAPVGDDR